MTDPIRSGAAAGTGGFPPAAPSTPRPALLFVATSVWIVISMTAGRLLSAFVPAAYADLVQQAAVAGLLFGGFHLIARSSVPDLRPLSSMGFVLRPGIDREFGVGAALGWAVALALLLPALLTGNLHLAFTVNAASLGLTLISLAVLTLFALNVQMVVAGLPARLLLRAGSPAWTALATILIAPFVIFLGQPGRNALFVMLAAALFSTAFLRTRALWLPLGLQAAWTVSLQLLFGATSPYTPAAPGIAQSQAGGAIPLTGGALGPEASGFAVLVLIVALVVLFRLTRDYAWHYTYQPVEGAGYPMDVAPPKEHVRMEQQAAPLVQIGGLPQPAATPVPPDSAP